MCMLNIPLLLFQICCALCQLTFSKKSFHYNIQILSNKGTRPPISGLTETRAGSTVLLTRHGVATLSSPLMCGIRSTSRVHLPAWRNWNTAIRWRSTPPGLCIRIWSVKRQRSRQKTRLPCSSIRIRPGSPSSPAKAIRNSPRIIPLAEWCARC